MLIGPAGGGKTAVRQILQRALVFLPSVQNREQQEKPGEDFDEASSGKSAMTHLVSIFLIYLMIKLLDSAIKIK